MGTIIKFVINMEGLDADLDQIQNRLALTPCGLWDFFFFNAAGGTRVQAVILVY
jgi:hypothetical protein